MARKFPSIDQVDKLVLKILDNGAPVLYYPKQPGTWVYIDTYGYHCGCLYVHNSMSHVLIGLHGGCPYHAKHKIAYGGDHYHKFEPECIERLRANITNLLLMESVMLPVIERARQTLVCRHYYG